jgi:hypothetical protein
MDDVKFFSHSTTVAEVLRSDGSRYRLKVLKLKEMTNKLI